MNFTEVTSEVVGIIKRPDLISQVRREVNSALRFYCLDNKFARDFQEQVIALDSAEYTQSFALSLLTRFRVFRYIRRGGTTEYLDLLGDDEIFTKDSRFTKNQTKCDKYYIVGENVNIAMRKLAASLDVGYYVYPPVLTGNAENNSHWLLDLQPFMIIDRACATLFRNIGDEKSMQAHAASAREGYLACRKDLLSAS